MLVLFVALLLISFTCHSSEYLPYDLHDEFETTDPWIYWITDGEQTVHSKKFYMDNHDFRNISFRFDVVFNNGKDHYYQLSKENITVQ